MATIAVPSGRLELTDNSLVFLLHFDGDDGSTTITEETGKTVTANGNAQIDTARSKFGSGSYLSDGTGDFLSTPMTPDDFNLGTGDFTIEGWLYRTANEAASDRVFQTRDGDVVGGVSLSYGAATTLSAAFSSNGTSFDIGSGNTSSTITLNTWVPWAVERTGTTFRMYVGGVNVGTNYTSSAAVYYNSAHTCVIGGQTSGRSTIGSMDEIAVFKGRSLYKGNQYIPRTDPIAYTRPALLIELVPVVIPVDSGASTLAGQAPEITRYVAVGVGSVTSTGYAPEVTIPGLISPAAATATVTGQAPAIDVDYSVSVAAGSVAATGSAPAVSINYYLATGAGALTLTGQEVLAAVPQFITGVVGTHTLTGQAVLPVIGVVALPGVGAMSITGQAGTAPIAWSMPAGTLTAAGNAPALYIGQYTPVGAGAASIAGQSFGHKTGFAMTAGSVAFTGHAPVDAQGVRIAAVGAGGLILTGQSPSIPLLSSPSYNVVSIEALF